MKRLSLGELVKALLATSGLLTAAVVLLGKVAGRTNAEIAAFDAVLLGFVFLVSGAVALVYALGQLGAGGELAGHNFGSAVGAFIGAYASSRDAAAGLPPAELVAAAERQLPGAAEQGGAARADRGPDGAVLVSRYLLRMALVNTVIRWHAGKRISRKAMTGEQVVDQRYWNLATHVCIELGLRERNSSRWVTRGSQALDLEWVTGRVVVLAHKSVWVAPAGSDVFQEVDLAACFFLNAENRSGVPAGEEGASEPAGAPAAEAYTPKSGGANVPMAGAHLAGRRAAGGLLVPG